MNFGNIAYAFSKRVHSLLLAGIRIRNVVLGKSDPRKRFHAEFFTDKYIRKNFFPDFTYQGCMVEVGCATPELLSMSQHFRETGWRCIGVEPNPQFVGLHKARGNEVLEYAASDFEADDVEFTVAQSNAEYSDTDLSAHSFSSLKIKPEFMGYKNGVVKNYALTPIKVKVRKLDNILALHCAEVTRVDILSVDVEGYELEVMKGFSPDKYGVKLIVLENLFHSPEYTEYMESIGYKLHSKIMYNYMYVPAGS